MINRVIVVVVSVLMASWLSFSVAAKPVYSMVFLDQAEAAQVLKRNDDFVQRISQFDIDARMKQGTPQLKADYLNFVAQQTLNWEESERLAITTAFNSISEKLKSLNVHLPKPIQLIKTTGIEEGNAAYTRGQAIILQARQVKNEAGLARLLAHELLHVFSRFNPTIKAQLYNAIGYHFIGDIEFPTTLVQQKITNPDAPINDFAIQVEYQHESVWVVPILYSALDRYDLKKGGEFFDYLNFKFVVIGRTKELNYHDYNAQQPEIIAVSDLKGFFEQVGHNTDYIIHPEEIIADNFALLVTGKSQLVSPQITRQIEQVLLSN
ncbi:eCIS core domain-containing protein [Shewanella youngdeokensis]|uniref:DUF4157 domain-containing protein n=1 Tax=Shewanella youngdeokensis TaxID=2999068 RepID=A0ABZ0K025_9GAMM|nr:DUF4157 domain-containing protein [Shewanella sp. DAU334]